MNRWAGTWLVLGAFAAAAIGIGASNAVAQVTRIQLGKSEDLRAVYANAADVAEGKRFAEATCASCHGAGGISALKGVPHLGGQRAGYTYLELKAYQSGERADRSMSNVVKPLSDDALVKLAAYYASLDPPQPISATGTKSPPAKVDSLQAGKTAAAACAGCHGDTGTSRVPGTPSLTGLDPKYLVAAMKAYRGGQRKNDTMKATLASLTDADLGNIALFFAVQTPARAQTPAGGDASRGKPAAAACAGCHGDTGTSANPEIPSLAGQDVQYLATALLAYKEGRRADDTMKGLAASLDETTAKDVAAFYASQQPRPTNVRRPLTTAEWAQRCDRCHGVDGNSTDPHLPALAAQRADYLERVLLAYRKGERKSPQMAAMLDALTDADIEGLAAHYARQKARAVVYIQLPAK